LTLSHEVMELGPNGKGDVRVIGCLKDEAPRSKLRGIQRNCAVANSSSFSQDETNPSSL
jgi:hypothetical protein